MNTNNTHGPINLQLVAIGPFKILNITLFRQNFKGDRNFFCLAAAVMARSRLKNKKKEKVMALITKESLVKEAFSANLIYRLLKNNRLELTERLWEFFYLFQVPEVRQSIFVKITELKFIFKDEIAAHFKEVQNPCKK